MRAGALIEPVKRATSRLVQLGGSVAQRPCGGCQTAAWKRTRAQGLGKVRECRVHTL
jgi:hypothetical protein